MNHDAHLICGWSTRGYSFAEWQESAIVRRSWSVYLHLEYERVWEKKTTMSLPRRFEWECFPNLKQGILPGRSEDWHSGENFLTVNFKGIWHSENWRGLFHKYVFLDQLQEYMDVWLNSFSLVRKVRITVTSRNVYSWNQLMTHEFRWRKNGSTKPRSDQ